jgi:UDP:flavonoid glycosyltransferase YjiC (YdhE family)
LAVFLSCGFSKKNPVGLESPPANVFVTAWSPQKAVLGHPAVTAFFSHGGGNSILESLAAGVPLIIMPFFGDQPMNAMIHAELGVAIKVNKRHFSAASFAADFKEISRDKYQRRAAEIKALNDKHVSLPRAVEVVENAAARRFPMKMTQPSISVAWLPMAMLVIILYVAKTCCQRCQRCCLFCCCCFGRQSKASHAKVE